jgi:hypothetical protein
MFKYILFIAANTVLLNTAKCQKADTSVFYFKNDANGIYSVSSLGDADFVRMILPPDSADTRVNVKEFYKNGQIKFIGKSDPQPKDKFKPGEILLSGDCVSYYPNGKKQSITHYSKGIKEGLEYLYYPSGTIYYVTKYVNAHGMAREQRMNWECYNTDGNIICSNGNGRWIIYDRWFKNVIFQGPVKNGSMDGKWMGNTMRADSIKYTCDYQMGTFIAGVGYDKNGAAYPFIMEKEPATYQKESMVAFLGDLRRNLDLPRGTNRKKMTTDTILVSFIVGKDGYVTNVETSGDTTAALSSAIKTAMNKCHAWTPSRYFGVPFRTKIVLQLKCIYTDYENSGWQKIPLQQTMVEP